MERKLDEMSVPFYLYVPKKLRANKKPDTSVVGSHTDILPTLYNVSLSNTPYWATGTDLLSDEAEKNIASNCTIRPQQLSRAEQRATLATIYVTPEGKIRRRGIPQAQAAGIAKCSQSGRIEVHYRRPSTLERIF